MDPSSSPQLRGPLAWMASNPVAANLLMIILLLSGLSGLASVKQEVFPEFELDMVVVSVIYPGASPTEVEQGISLALEESVRGLDGVKRVSSVSREDSAQVYVDLLLGADGEKALADIKSAVDGIRSFPEEAERPQVRLVESTPEVISLIISGEQELSILHELAEQSRQRLLEHEDITKVEIFGVKPLEVSIEIGREQLESYGLTLDEVARQVAAASVELPAGGVETNGGEILVRVADRRVGATAFADIVLRGTNRGYDVRLGDIAQINDGYADTDLASYFAGRPAVRITAYRVGSETPMKVAAAVRGHAADLGLELPSELSVDVWGDESELLQGRIELLTDNARIGLLLVLVVLALFLDVKLAFWVAVGIPVCFLGAFALLPGLDVSVNMVSLFAFIITLGLVVDDAIIVGENIFQKLDAGMEPLRAAVDGAREMAVPVSFAILTTVAAFAPLMDIPGFSGKIFRIIPLVVISVLFLSLVESFLILPAHLAHMKRGTGIKRTGLLAPLSGLHRFASGGLRKFGTGIYEPFLRRVLAWRYVAMACAIASFVLTIGLIRGGLVPFSFFPKLEGDVVVATAKLPFGTPVEQTLEVQTLLENAAREALAASGEEDILRGMFSRLGEGPQRRAGQRAEGSHLVTVELNLVPSEGREISAIELSGLWEDKTPDISGLESLIFSAEAGPGAGAAVAIQLSHPDSEQLAEASLALTRQLRSFEDLTAFENTFASGKPRLDYHLLPEARSLGLTSQSIGRQLRSAFFGVEALREQRGRNEVKVMVRLPEEQRRSEFDIEQLEVLTPTGGSVPLASVARFERGRSPTEIRREDGARVVTVSAELRPGVTSSREVLTAVNENLLPELVEGFPGLEFSMVGEQREQAETFSSLGRGYVLALFAIYALLAIPFKSYTQPLIVMSAIPFGFVGAVGGHLVMGFELSIISMMGIIALSGVVVNDSLVLVDAANRYRRANAADAFDAIVHGGVRRLRPIVLTSLTTFFGLVPMILETSLQAKFLIPMAISLGFGVIFATVIILLVVPSLYLIREDILGLGASLWARIARHESSSGASELDL